MEYGAKHLKLLDDIGVPHGMFIEALYKGGEMLDDIQTDIMLHAAQVRADSKTAGDLLSLIEQASAEPKNGLPGSGYFVHVANTDGGPGSGNWGHSGRPGKRGGSAGGGGVHNRMTDNAGGFTSFSKQQKQAAKPHVATMQEVGLSPEGTKLIWGKSTFVKYSGGWLDEDTAESYSAYDMLDNLDGEPVRFAIPKSASPNYNKPKKTKSTSEDDIFSEERRKNAFSTSDPQKADDLLREKSGKVWRSIDQDAKNALASYTGSGYMDINDALRNDDFWGNSDRNRVNRITDAISKSTLDEDMWLYRGFGTAAAEKMFELDDGDLSGVALGDSDFDIQSLVGLEGTDKGFISCGTAEGKGFSSRPVQLKIFTPKGTEALYAEPFSKNGAGDKQYWDGSSKQSWFSSEFETIIQRGSTLKIVSATKEGSHLVLETVVTGQRHETIPLQ